MRLFTKRQLPILLLVFFLLVFVLFIFLRPPPPQRVSFTPSHPALSMLAPPPNWSALNIYQDTITRAEFEQLLTTVFTTGDAWKTYITLNDDEAQIQTGKPSPEQIFTLHFAKLDSTKPIPRHWKTSSERQPAARERPLTGIKIAIDPGHIGGAWAKMEERWFVVGNEKPVQEGDMTLQVARLLKPRLEALGASVTLVRDRLEPVTPIRPDALLSLAQDSTANESPQKLAERLFYRTAEIRARADVVNQVIKPDLVLCLHFNAEGWGNPNSPMLIDRTHLHLLLNGAYTDDEVILADQRFTLLEKLLQRTHEEEVLVGATVSKTFAEISGLPPYVYPPASKSVRSIAEQPYLWVRNLLANRLYNCPVIFMEPYVMNSTLDHARIQAGDYEGLREVAGKMRPSIFREYADAVTEGFKRHYNRPRMPNVK